MVFVVLTALALPIGLVVWAFAGKSSKSAPEPTELRNALNAIAEKGLPSTSLSTETPEIALMVADVPKASKSLSALVAELGGTSLEGDPASGISRIVVSLGPDKLPEFQRQTELLTGQKLSLPDVPPPLLVITLTPAGKP